MDCEVDECLLFIVTFRDVDQIIDLLLKNVVMIRSGALPETRLAFRHFLEGEILIKPSKGK